MCINIVYVIIISNQISETIEERKKENPKEDKSHFLKKIEVYKVIELRSNLDVTIIWRNDVTRKKLRWVRDVELITFAVMRWINILKINVDSGS